MLQASAELTGGGVSPITVLRARPAAAGEPSRTRSDDGREPEDADPYQRHADEEELQSEPSESSEEDELSDEDGDGALPHQPLLLLQHSGGRQQKKKTPKADRIGIAPRSLVELGKLKPEEILNAESTFPSAEHCAFVLKELSVRLRTPGCLSITMRRGQSGQCVSVTCSCSGGTSSACKFDVHFKPRKESKSKVEHARSTRRCRVVCAQTRQRRAHVPARAAGSYQRRQRCAAQAGACSKPQEVGDCPSSARRARGTRPHNCIHADLYACWYMRLLVVCCRSRSRGDGRARTATPTSCPSR